MRQFSLDTLERNPVGKQLIKLSHGVFLPPANLVSNQALKGPGVTYFVVNVR